MNRPPPEHGSHTAETSFIEGTPSGRVLDSNSLKIRLANQTLKHEYPQYGKNGLFALEVKTVKLKWGEKDVVFVRGPRGGYEPLFKDDGRRINPKVLRIKAHLKILGPHRSELIQQKDEEIAEVDKAIQEDTMFANDENEEPTVRERACEKIREKNEQKNPACK